MHDMQVMKVIRHIALPTPDPGSQSGAGGPGVDDLDVADLSFDDTLPSEEPSSPPAELLVEAGAPDLGQRVCILTIHQPSAETPKSSSLAC